jgi:antitoxin HicB
MSEQLRYSMLIQWSNEDEAYVVSFPEWENRVFNPVTHGKSYDEAVRNGKEALEGLVESAKKHGESVPEPKLAESTVQLA